MLVRPLSAAAYASYARKIANHPSMLISDSSRYQWMFNEFQRICVSRPYLCRATVARDVGAQAFEIELPLLLSQRRDKQLASARQKIMTFASLASGMSTRSVGRVFGRAQNTILLANKKYAKAVQRAIDRARAEQTEIIA